LAGANVSMVKQHFLDSFLNPKSIAIVGASTNPKKMSYYMVDNLVKFGFPGKIYPVNPAVSEVLGIKAYPSLKHIKDDIDLVASAVPVHMTLDIIKECAEKRVKGVIIISGGFSEAGEEGARMQHEIAHILKQNGIRAMGPNSLGPVNTSNNFLVSFQSVGKLNRGGVSFIFQSGFYELRINWILSDFHLGVSKVLDLGNKMDINEVDALEYLAEDPDTKAIAIHLETVKGDGRKFGQLLRNTSKNKPIIVFKSGCTAAGAKAAGSHTGSIAKENDIVFDALLKQAGVLRAHSIEDLFDFAKAFEFLTPPGGNRIAVATISGGEGVISTDICQKNGFVMAEPSQRALNKLRVIFPPWDIPANPFDYGPCQYAHQLGKIYRVFLQAMLYDDNVDCLAVQLPVFGFYQDSEDLYEPFLLAKEQKKPIAVWRTGLSRRGDVLVERLESNRIPVYPSAERAIKSLSAICEYATMHEEDI